MMVFEIYGYVFKVKLMIILYFLVINHANLSINTIFYSVLCFSILLVNTSINDPFITIVVIIM